jgi:hypothetical protein
MEKITTRVTIETDKPEKAYKLVDKMVKKGFTYESTNMETQPAYFLKGRYTFELTKEEQFK